MVECQPITFDQGFTYVTPIIYLVIYFDTLALCIYCITAYITYYCVVFIFHFLFIWSQLIYYIIQLNGGNFILS